MFCVTGDVAVSVLEVELLVSEVVGLDDDNTLFDVTLSEMGCVGVVEAVVWSVVGVVGVESTLFVFVEVLFESSAKESGKAYCGKIKIAESKSGIKNFVFILSQFHIWINKKL